MTAPDLGDNVPAPIQADADPKIRAAIFSEPGIGKTELGLGFPRPLVIDTDFGLEGDALRALGEAGGLSWTPEPGEGAQPGHKQLEALWFWCRDNSDDFDTIMFDSGPTLCQLLLNEVVDAGKGKASKDQLITDFVPEQAEYQVLLRQFDRVLTDFRRLKKHMVVTFGVRERDGKRCPDLIPSLLPVVNHWCSVAGELLVLPFDLETGELDDEADDHRILAVRPTAGRWAKSRYASMLPYVVEPVFEITEGSRPGATALWDLMLETPESD